MCGVAATLGFAPDAAHRAAVLSSLAHRGPDGHGCYVREDVFIGHTRLAIIDLSEAASQPMVSDDGRYVLAYNGEIYNHVELRGPLESRGWRFRGTGDTEVLLAALAMEGEACLPRLRGMFAFALWDGQRRRLLAARDALGIKPLYYAHGDRTILASELRTMALLGAGARVDPVAVETFLLTGSVIGPRTILEGVRSLPPGHLVSFEDGIAREKVYWRVPDEAAELRPRDELVSELDGLLRDGIRQQLRSDVPVGTFLSGGIDSSLITSYAAEEIGEGLHTFSVGFGDASARWDETNAAKLVSDRYRTQHHRVVVSRSDFRAQMQTLPAVIDQPSADGVNSYFVSGAAAAHVKVALSGQGGDELFAGYNIFQFASRLSRLIERLPTPPPAAAHVGRLALRLPARLQHNWYVRGAAGVLTRGDPALIAQMTNPLFSPLEVNVAVEPRIESVGNLDLVNVISRQVLTGYLPHTLLRDMDAMSMAHSLEVRVPLVDPVLAEFALSIPGTQKVSWGNSKSLLRDIAATRLPPALRARSKQGFNFPLAEWLRARDCDDLLIEALAPDRVREAALVPEKTVAHELARLRRPLPGDLLWLRAQRVWALYVLHEWHDHWRSLQRGAPVSMVASATV
ncbi:MAG: asparagine synthase (glutamine-hydrolyzing) [Solirubrobacterales bacterium]|nr:asparagine synthase (glutamine-hydrolyzing) [Solirubrobacterales bacterium]